MVKMKGDNKNQSGREKLNYCLKGKLEEEFYKLQKYGTEKARKLKIAKKDIERLVFEDR